VVEVAVAQEDVADGGRVDAGAAQSPHEAETPAGVEQHARRSRVDENRRLVALGVERAAGAEKDDARARHRGRA
jgi:hypothetical protein